MSELAMSSQPQILSSQSPQKIVISVLEVPDFFTSRTIVTNKGIKHKASRPTVDSLVIFSEVEKSRPFGISKVGVSIKDEHSKRLEGPRLTNYSESHRS